MNERDSLHALYAAAPRITRFVAVNSFRAVDVFRVVHTRSESLPSETVRDSCVGFVFIAADGSLLELQVPDAVAEEVFPAALQAIADVLKHDMLEALQ